MPIINDKYYFMNSNMDVNNYSTLWRGYFKFIYNNTNYILSGLDVDNILLDICDINFYIHLDQDYIYISICQDEKYYVYQFEKHCKKIVAKLEEICDIYITYGEFNATELKQDGNQYKYTLTKTEDKKISLRKKTLNWEIFEKKRKESTNHDIDIVENDLKKINIHK